MKFKYLILTFFICFFAVTSVFSAEHVYFLIDKSRSMWAHDNPNDDQEKNALGFAKDRVYEAIRSNPPQKGKRNIYIFLFDSELKSYSKEIFSLQEAINLLEPIKPGGRTTIGDRLEEVRLRIRDAGIDSVEIHLLSDMEETEVGDISKEVAIQRLNNDLQAERSRLGVKLIAYTWKKGLQCGDIKNLKVECRPLQKKAIRASIGGINEIIMELTENQGQFDSAKTGQTKLTGYFDIAFHNTQTRFTVSAEIQEMPDVKLMLNGQEKTDIGRFAKNNGEINLQLNVQIQNPNIFQRYLSSPNFANRRFTVAFTPILDSIPTSLQRQYTIDEPNARKCALTFTAQPYIYVKNYPQGRTIYRANLPEGGEIKELIELAWNQGAVGKTVEWTLPQSGNMFGYMTLPNGQEARKFELDHTLSRTLLFNMDNIRNLSDQTLKFSIRGTDIDREIPVKIKAKPLALYFNYNNIKTEHYFENSSRIITPGLTIEPNTFNMPHPLDLTLQLSECSGTACDGLTYKLIDQTNTALVITKSIPQNLRIDAPIWFDMEITTKSSGNAQLGLIAKSSKKVLLDNNQYYKSKKYSFDLNIRPKKDISVSFQPLQALTFSLVEDNGTFTKINPQNIQIKGMVSPGFIKQNKKLSLKAKIQEFPNIVVTLDNHEKLDCTNYIDNVKQTIEIMKLPIAITGYQAQDLLRSQSSQIIGNQFHLLLTPEISPKPTQDELQKYHYPTPTPAKTSLVFHCNPLIEINPQQAKKKVYVGESTSFSFIMKWNLCLQDKNILWRLPDANLSEKCWISHEQTNNQINDFRLDRSLESRFILHIEGIKDSFHNQFLTIQVQKMPYKIKLPIEITAERPHIKINAKTAITQILQTDPINVPEAIILNTNFNDRKYPVNISLLGCQGSLCNDLEFSLIDENDQNNSASFKSSLKINMQNDRRFMYKILSTKAGKAELTINFSAKNNIFYHNQGYTNQVRKEINLDIVIPELKWEAKLKHNNVQIGTVNKPIPFRTFGKPQTTKDDAIVVSAKFNADQFNGDVIRLKIKVESDKNPPLVKDVFFNETKTDDCTIEEFLKNPHFTLTIDKEQKNWFTANSEKGKVIIIFSPDRYNVNNTVSIYYSMKLEP